MSKRETTMEALKYTIDLFKNRSQITFSCHDYFINMLEMAYDLLKEQEAVEPTLIREGRNKHYNDYVCPRCDNDVVYEQNYCSECGVQFLWEGR